MADKTCPLTQRRLMILLKYNSETGEFHWNGVEKNQRKGRLAGHKTKIGYTTIRIDGISYYAHRLAHLWVTGSMPSKDIDHIDGNKGNNRWDNLREATDSQNLSNQKIASTNMSGYKGVSWDAPRVKWKAQIQKNGVNYFIGRFDKAEDAALAYDHEAEILHGNFAVTNQSMGLLDV